MTDAKKNYELCVSLGQVVSSYRGRLNEEQKSRIKRDALKLKLKALSALNRKADLENCEGNKDRGNYYSFATYCKACDILESL